MHHTHTRITFRIAPLITPMLPAAATAQGVIRVDFDLKQIKRFSSAILSGKVTVMEVR